MTNPTKQEWWEDERYVEFNGGQELPTVYNIPAIVAEAEQMGRVAAYTEMREEWPRYFKIVDYDMTLEAAKTAVGYTEAVSDTIQWLDAKLTELKKV